MGTMRLAQELYRWLTVHHDPATETCSHGYWPDSFTDEAAKDSVNPKFAARPRPEIPFLWWGLKFKEHEDP